MKQKLNITKGKWIISTGCRIRDEHDNSIALCAGDASDFDWKTNEANAQLMAEAGTVANETGFTPRQLADQKKDLLEACIKAKKLLDLLARMNIQPFPISAAQLNRDLITILSSLKKLPPYFAVAESEV